MKQVDEWKEHVKGGIENAMSQGWTVPKIGLACDIHKNSIYGFIRHLGMHPEKVKALEDWLISEGFLKPQTVKEDAGQYGPKDPIYYLGRQIEIIAHQLQDPGIPYEARVKMYITFIQSAAHDLDVQIDKLKNRRY